MVSKPEIVGKELMERVLSRNKDYGGILAEVTGSPGSSKTSVLLSITKSTIINHPDEKIFWREQVDAPLQIFKLGNDSYHFYVKDTSNIIFRDRDKKLQLIKNFDDKVTYFSTFAELYEISKPGIANVVFFDDNFQWMEFITFLRNVGTWTNVFIDEMADICPMNNQGDLYKRIQSFASTMGAVRRCMINVLYNTQTVQDIDWRVRKKVMMKIFMPGAIADTKMSRVTQNAIDNLVRDPVHGNEAWIDNGGEFGRIRFKDIFKPIPGYHIEAHHNQTVLNVTV